VGAGGRLQAEVDLAGYDRGHKWRLNSVRGSLPPLVCTTVRAPFEAHGSSRGRALVMSTLRARAFTRFPVDLVMTVTVDGRQIAVGVGSTVPIQVVSLQQRLRREEESTAMTAAPLSFQQSGFPAWDASVAPPTRGPVLPVPVERACDVPHFAVPDDRHIGVPVDRQPVLGGKHPPLPLVRAPVTLDDPVARLAGASVACPSREFQVQLMV
jgi:hypothetical protein